MDGRTLAGEVRSAELSTTGRAGLDDADLAALGSLGIDADEVLGRAEDLLGSPEDDPWRPGRPGGHIRFADPAKRVLVQALRQALDLRHREISCDHLLLGLLAADGAAAAHLRRAGVDLPAARAAVQRSRRRAG